MIRPAARQPASLLLMLLFALVFLERGFSEPTEGDILDWLRNDDQALPYRSNEAELRKILEGAAGRIPLSLLFDKLKEGSSKRVPARKLMEFLGDERGRLFKTEELMRSTAFPISDREKPEIYKICSIALLNGLDEALLSSVLRNAKDRENPFEAVREVLPVLFRMNVIAPLPSGEAESFAAAVVGGRLSPEQYGSLVSIYLKAIAGKLSEESALRIMEDSLRSGGGILQVEREVMRRIRR